MGHPALKKFIIQGLTTSTTLGDLAGCTFSIMTAFGLITGKLAKNDDQSKLLVTKMCETLCSFYKKDYRTADNGLGVNDGYICLEDVEVLRDANTKLTFGELTVFYDQIIAITINAART